MARMVPPSFVEKGPKLQTGQTGQTHLIFEFFPGNLGRAAFVILMMLQDIFVNNVFLF